MAGTVIDVEAPTMTADQVETMHRPHLTREFSRSLLAMHAEMGEAMHWMGNLQTRLNATMRMAGKIRSALARAHQDFASMPLSGSEIHSAVNEFQSECSRPEYQGPRSRIAPSGSASSHPRQFQPRPEYAPQPPSSNHSRSPRGSRGSASRESLEPKAGAQRKPEGTK